MNAQQYYARQLDKIKPCEEQPVRMLLTCQDNKTNWLNVNSDSIPHIRLFLDRIEKELK